ncbi:MAG: hypothetical protein VXW60_03215, partial [Bacteroidota bacterium]|nr:hypothetical protein [Bacteroidota bacterium]
IENNNLKLDCSSIGLIGYSVGAQAASRAMNDFPFMKTTSGKSFPKIQFSIMIAGGSYFCYENKTLTCPKDKFEDSYTTGKLKWEDHPYVLLIQQKNDFFADPMASLYYKNNLEAHVKHKVTRVTSNSNTHGIENFEQTEKAVEFAVLHMKTQKNQNSENSEDGDKKHGGNSVFHKLVYIIMTVVAVALVYMGIEFHKFSPFTRVTLGFTGVATFSSQFFIFPKSKQPPKPKPPTPPAPPPPKNEITKQDILQKFASKDGLLATLNATSLYCPGYQPTLLDCYDDDYENCTGWVPKCPLGRDDINCECMKASQCSVFDVNDVEHILKYNMGDAGTTCYAIDTTWLHESIPPQLFGPLMMNYNTIGESFPIGILLDTSVLLEAGYIGCAFAQDSGSIGRNFSNLQIDPQVANKCKTNARNITDEEIQAGKLHETSHGDLSISNCPARTMIGC